MSDDDGEMTELNDGGGPGFIAKVGPRAHRHDPKYDGGRLSGIVAKVRPFVEDGLSPEAIAEKLEVSVSRVNRAIGRVNAALIRKIRDKPDAEKGRLYRRYERIAGRSLDKQKVVDKKGNVVEISPTAANVSNAIKATQEQANLAGLNAPTRSESLSAHVRINPEAQQALISNPEYCELVMRLEELHRHATEGPGHVPGAVRGSGLEGQLALRPPSGDPQSPDGPDGAGQDPPPGDLHASEAREVGIPFEILPGVVLRHLPGSEGDPGKLQC